MSSSLEQRDGEFMSSFFRRRHDLVSTPATVGNGSNDESFDHTTTGPASHIVITPPSFSAEKSVVSSRDKDTDEDIKVCGVSIRDHDSLSTTSLHVPMPATPVLAPMPTPSASTAIVDDFDLEYDTEIERERERVDRTTALRERFRAKRERILEAQRLRAELGISDVNETSSSSSSDSTALTLASDADRSSSFLSLGMQSLGPVGGLVSILMQTSQADADESANAFSSDYFTTSEQATCREISSYFFDNMIAKSVWSIVQEKSAVGANIRHVLRAAVGIGFQASYASRLLEYIIWFTLFQLVLPYRFAIYLMMLTHASIFYLTWFKLLTKIDIVRNVIHHCKLVELSVYLSEFAYPYLCIVIYWLKAIMPETTVIALRDATEADRKYANPLRRALYLLYLTQVNWMLMSMFSPEFMYLFWLLQFISVIIMHSLFYGWFMAYSALLAVISVVVSSRMLPNLEDYPSLALFLPIAIFFSVMVFGRIRNRHTIPAINSDGVEIDEEDDDGDGDNNNNLAFSFTLQGSQYGLVMHIESILEKTLSLLQSVIVAGIWYTPLLLVSFVDGLDVQHNGFGYHLAVALVMNVVYAFFVGFFAYVDMKPMKEMIHYLTYVWLGIAIMVAIAFYYQYYGIWLTSIVFTSLFIFVFGATAIVPCLPANVLRDISNLDAVD